MWTCPTCGRIFEKAKQPHSCHLVPLEEHFKNKDKSKELFDHLVEQINTKIGKCKAVSLPCCIHLFGKYDFLAILPKRDGLEVRFGLDRPVSSSRITQTVAMSTKSVKNCLLLKSKAEIDEEILEWLSLSYHLKDS